MNTTTLKTSLFRLTGALAVTFALGATTPAVAADAKAPASKAKSGKGETAKPVKGQRSTKVKIETKRARAELPRKWVWKKRVRTFDAMFRR